MGKRSPSYEEEEEEGENDSREREPPQKENEDDKEEGNGLTRKRIVITVIIGGRGRGNTNGRGRTRTTAATVHCQVDGCGAELLKERRYHRRHKVCEEHARAIAVSVDGLDQRYCQQCSRFHEIFQFDGVKRSCRDRLAGHNERRRKINSDPSCKDTTQKSVPCATEKQEKRSVSTRTEMLWKMVDFK